MGVPVICFPREIKNYKEFCEIVKPDAVNIDYNVDPLMISKNIKILGINLKDEKSQANKFLKKMGNPYYLIASDYDGKKAVHFGVYGIPETILVKKDLNLYFQSNSIKS